jgi:hypothetical protein
LQIIDFRVEGHKVGASRLRINWIPMDMKRLAAKRRNAMDRRTLIRSTFSRVGGRVRIAANVKPPAKTPTLAKETAIVIYDWVGDRVCVD